MAHAPAAADRPALWVKGWNLGGYHRAPAGPIAAQTLASWGARREQPGRLYGPFDQTTPPSAPVDAMPARILGHARHPDGELPQNAAALRHRAEAQPQRRASAAPEIEATAPLAHGVQPLEDVATRDPTQRHPQSPVGSRAALWRPPPQPRCPPQHAGASARGNRLAPPHGPWQNANCGSSLDGRLAPTQRDARDGSPWRTNRTERGRTPAGMGIAEINRRRGHPAEWHSAAAPWPSLSPLRRITRRRLSRGWAAAGKGRRILSGWPGARGARRLRTIPLARHHPQKGDGHILFIGRL